jgi:hypothetical protein
VLPEQQARPGDVMMILFRLFMGAFYYWSMTSFLSFAAYPPEVNAPIALALYIHLGLKLLFITLQDKGGEWHFLKFLLEAILITIFAPDAWGFLAFMVVFGYVVVAYMKASMFTTLYFGTDPLTVRRAMHNRIVRQAAMRPPDKNWTY